MKVLHIINSLGTGGAEKLLVGTLPLYIEKGLNVELLLLNGTRTPFFDALEKVSKLTIHHLGYGSLLNPLHSFRILPFMKGYDIIHVHLFPAFYWTAFAKILSRSETMLIFTKHSTSNRRMDASYFTKKIEKWILRKYSKIITISAEVDYHLKKRLQFPEDRFCLIENGINLAEIENASPSRDSFFRIRQKVDKIIIQVASFRTPKDQQTLIKAIALLPKNVKLLLVGDGPQKVHCEKLVQNLCMQERIKFLGARTDIPQLLKASDIVVLSTNYEGFSLSVVEGMAAGKPTIASDVPGVREIVKNAGIHFPKGDERILAHHITNLITDSNYYNTIAIRCLERSKEYSINKMVEKHICLYEKALQTRDVRFQSL